MMKASAAELLQQLPGPVTPQWITGERFIQALRHGSMSVEFYAPIDSDPQTGIDHRFEHFSANFSTWVVFWGPIGGEQDPMQSR
jgi:hypothetical protein